MPATTALTAAASTGRSIARPSSRDAAVSCNRHGTSAAAGMQASAVAARSADSSPRATRTASARAATSRIMAECRNRSGHGEKKEEEGASIVIRAALSPSFPFSSGAGVATLFQICGFALCLNLKPRLDPTQALQSRAQYNFAQGQQDYRYDERSKIIKDTKQQHSREQVLPIHLPQADQHGGIEYAKPPGGMTGEAQQRCGNKDHRDHDKAKIRLIRHQHVHRQRAKAEIDNTNRDLQQRQW